MQVVASKRWALSSHPFENSDFEKQYLSERYAAQIFGNSSEGHHWRNLVSDSDGATLAGLSKRILFHHIWKTGGTHFCDLALDSGLAAPRNDGCHRWRYEQSATYETSTDAVEWIPCAISADDGDADELESTPFNVIGHECPVNAELVELGHVHGFEWVTILRCPLEQAASWYRHILHIGPETVEERTVTWPTAMDWAEQHSELGGFESFVDNIQTRWLAGHDCISVEEVTAECLDAAKANLRKMDDVLEQSGRGLVGMDNIYALGWPKPADSEKDGTPQPDETTEYVGNMSSHERSYFEGLQKYDIELLSWARAEGILSQLAN